MLKVCVIDCDMKVDLCLKFREYTTSFVTLPSWRKLNNISDRIEFTEKNTYKPY